jgi:hypothetical protein
MAETFNGAAEPMRAIRDMIVLFEQHVLFIDDQEYLDRARDAFTALRKLFGDERPAEDIADAAMIEPPVKSVAALTTALQSASGALYLFERHALIDPNEPIKFTSEKWAHLGTLTLSQIIDQANEALESA